MTTTTTTESKGSKKGAEKIGSVIFEKVSSEHVNAALIQLGVTKKPKGSLAARTQQLVDKFIELNEKQDLYVCEPEDGGCGGEFTEDFANCPFCGLADEEAEPETTIVKVEPLPKALQKFSAEDLDQDVDAIIELKQQTAICMWDLGDRILQNYDREFWKLRRNDDGTQKYTNVKQFWAEELGFSHTYCYSLMDIAKNFKKDDVKEVGTTKLALILRAPDRKRPALLKAAKGGASKADIAKQVRAAVAEADGRTPDGDEAGDGEPRKRRLTVAAVPGRKTIKLFAAKTLKDEEPKRAKKIGDLPVGEMLFENNTMMTIKIAEKNGEMVAIVEFDRAK